MGMVVPKCIQVLRLNPPPSLVDPIHEGCTFDVLFTLHWGLLFLTTMTQLLHVILTVIFAAWGLQVLLDRDSATSLVERFAFIQEHSLWNFNWNLNRLQYIVCCLGFFLLIALGEKFSPNACGAPNNPDQETPANLWMMLMFPMLTKFVVTMSVFAFINVVSLPSGAPPNVLRNLRSMQFSETALGDERQHDCTICLMTFQPTDVVVVLECSHFHIFHKSCAFAWFRLKNSCPLCRVETGERPHYT